MELTVQTYLIVLPLVFLAGFIDSIAGGGGLISLPAYYLAGLSPVLAAGTNKCSACIGTMAATGRYLAGGKISLKVALIAALGAFPGSWLGSTLLQMIPEKIIRYMMIAVIPLMALIVLRQGKIQNRRQSVPAGRLIPVSLVIGFGVGFYDGLVGPGTGTLLIMLFTLFLGMDGVLASGTAKVVNLASNIASLVNFTISGQVLFALSLPAALCAIGGNLLGAHLAIRKGTGFIRVVLLVVLALLLARMIFDVL